MIKPQFNIPAPGGSAEPTSPSRHVKVLVVESDANFLAKIHTILRNATLPEQISKFMVNVAGTLREAVDTLEIEKFDLILTEVNLPDASGFLVLQELLDFGRKAPLIALSNIRNWAMLSESAHIGVSAFLLKQTIDEDVLIQTILYAIERKKMQQRIDQAQSSFKSLVEILPIGLLQCDRKGIIQYVNQPAAGIFETKPETMLGRELSEIGTPNLGHAIKDLLKRTLDSGRSVEQEISFEDSSGQKVSLLGLTTPSMGEDKHVEAIQCILWDVSQNRKVEEEKQTSRLLTSLQSGLSTMANELNNALTPILLDAEILEQNTNSNETVDALHRIENCVSSARSILRPFLLSAGDLNPRTERLDPHKLLTGYLSKLQAATPEGIRIEYHLAEKFTGQLIADSALIQKMIDHLIKNAEEAMPKGGIIRLNGCPCTLEEHSREVATLDLKPGEFLKLTITDEGPGISPKDNQRIFEPFFTTKVDGQKGLGLSEALTIIKGLGGSIKMDQENDSGAKFDIYLPLNTSSVDHPDTKSPGVPKGNKQTILFVDDEDSIKQSVAILLANKGYKVLFASNGAEGLTLFQKHQSEIGLIISDVAMPVMDGMTFAEIVRKISPSMKIIFCTGVELKAKTDQLSEVKLNDVLYKPFNGKSLTDMVAKHIV